MKTSLLLVLVLALAVGSLAAGRDIEERMNRAGRTPRVTVGSFNSQSNIGTLTQVTEEPKPAPPKQVVPPPPAQQQKPVHPFFSWFGKKQAPVQQPQPVEVVEAVPVVTRGGTNELALSQSNLIRSRVDITGDYRNNFDGDVIVGSFNDQLNDADILQVAGRAGTNRAAADQFNEISSAVRINRGRPISAEDAIRGNPFFDRGNNNDKNVELGNDNGVGGDP